MSDYKICCFKYRRHRRRWRSQIYPKIRLAVLTARWIHRPMVYCTFLHRRCRRFSNTQRIITSKPLAFRPPMIPPAIWILPIPANTPATGETRGFVTTRRPIKVCFMLNVFTHRWMMGIPKFRLNTSMHRNRALFNVLCHFSPLYHTLFSLFLARFDGVDKLPEAEMH